MTQNMGKSQLGVEKRTPFSQSVLRALLHINKLLLSQGKLADDLAKSKADAKRLQDKLDDAHKSITELSAKLDKSILLDSRPTPYCKSCNKRYRKEAY